MPDFVLANLCDDLLEHTMIMCGKNKDKQDENYSDGKTLRFPAHLYDDIIPQVKLAANDILKKYSACKHN